MCNKFVQTVYIVQFVHCKFGCDKNMSPVRTGKDNEFSRRMIDKS